MNIAGNLARGAAVAGGKILKREITVEPGR